MQKIVQSQTDFTGGELDPQGKRREQYPLQAISCRQLSNWRPTARGTQEIRPGRRALAITANTRAERFRMSPTQELVMLFGAGFAAIADLAGNIIFSNGGYAWSAANVYEISWCVCPDRIVICFPGAQPQIIMWAQATNTFSAQPFTFQVNLNVSLEPFYRQAAPGISLSWDTTNTNGGDLGGSITLTSSAAYFTGAMVGTIISILGGQVRITGVTNSTTATVTVLSQLPIGVYFALVGTGAQDQFFPEGILAEATTDNMQVEITGFASNGYYGVCMTNNGVANSNQYHQYLVSDLGSDQVFGAQYHTGPVTTLQWQQEFMSSLAGWPSACFFDRDRLGFCGFPQLPEGVLWSAVGVYDGFWVDSTASYKNTGAGTAPTAAILEFMSGKPSVKNVVGWNGDEFVFTDKGVYEVPISAASQSALQPGSVQFVQISDDSANFVKPVLTKNALIFVNGGGTRVAAILRSSAFTQSVYVAQDLTDFYQHLIKNPVCITVSQGDGQYPERYIYVLNSDGTLAIGRLTGDQPIGTKQYVGWQPWSGAGNVLWISASLGTVYSLAQYGAVNVLEVEDITVFMDQAVFVNAAPANMKPAGKGPFTAFANGTVRLMNGEIDYGDRSVDANGNMIWSPDDDQSVAAMIAGKPFTSIAQPFVQEAGESKGQDVRQRQRRRRVSRGIVTVYGSSGFVWGDREIPPYNFGDDATQQPPLRETSYACRPIGRDYDPPPPILTKDTPGPLELLELTLEVSV